jgi:ATPase subunit of ABC transporter with duplicated ATPase domains
VDPHGVQHLQDQIRKMSPSHALLVISHDHAFLDKISTRTIDLSS